MCNRHEDFILFIEENYSRFFAAATLRSTHTIFLSRSTVVAVCVWQSGDQMTRRNTRTDVHVPSFTIHRRRIVSLSHSLVHLLDVYLIHFFIFYISARTHYGPKDRVSQSKYIKVERRWFSFLISFLLIFFCSVGRNCFSVAFGDCIGVHRA